MNGQYSVLVAEDDEDDRFFFQKALKELHLSPQVTFAGSYKELFECLEKNPDFNVVILDINLPGQSGKEILREIKAHERYKKLPVIMFTGSNRPADADETFGYGAHYYAIKPYSYINYREMVRRMFDIDWTTEQERPAKANYIINVAFV